jgi:hypothetical protein
MRTYYHNLREKIALVEEMKFTSEHDHNKLLDGEQKTDLPDKLQGKIINYRRKKKAEAPPFTYLINLPGAAKTTEDNRKWMQGLMGKTKDYNGYSLGHLEASSLKDLKEKLNARLQKDFEGRYDSDNYKKVRSASGKALALLETDPRFQQLMELRKKTASPSNQEMRDYIVSKTRDASEGALTGGVGGAGIGLGLGAIQGLKHLQKESNWMKEEVSFSNPKGLAIGAATTGALGGGIGMAMGAAGSHMMYDLDRSALKRFSDPKSMFYEPKLKSTPYNKLRYDSMRGARDAAKGRLGHLAKYMKTYGKGGAAVGLGIVGAVAGLGALAERAHK